MDSLQRLIRQAEEKSYRLSIHFDSQIAGEEWGIKLYPEEHSDAHFYSYHTSLDTAARLLLDELRGFSI